jgi:D-alanyl-D-alanine carboxypeptidase
MKPRTIAILQLACLALAVALFLWWIFPGKKEPKEIPVVENATTSQMASFPKVEIEAKAAYVYDVATEKVLYQKDAQLQWPLASLTKLMSALAASIIVPDYLLVRIQPIDLREEGDTGLYPDEEWNIGKLIDYSLIVSSNDGMRAIAAIAGSQLATSSSDSPEKLFVGSMNGLEETYFINQSGLDVTKTLSGGYGSAKDIALLVDYILKHNPHLVEATSFDNIVIASKNSLHPAVNTNKAILNIPNVLASKTGFTDLSGGNVVVAWNGGLDRPIIISVLGSSYDGRFADLTTLVKATMEYLATTSIASSIPLEKAQ